MKGGSKLGCIALAISTVGALNWGLVEFFQVNLVVELCGQIPHLKRGVYGLMGLSGLYGLYSLLACCKNKYCEHKG